MLQSKGYAARSTTSGLAPFSFERRDPLPDDVQIDILYSGICHSDIHQVRDEWGGAMFPMVPGHEIVGRVKAVGNDVTRFKPGDLAGVGVMVDSCRVCDNCKSHEEPYCQKGFVGTYNAKDYAGKVVYGGYADNIVVNERYVHTLSPKLEPKLAAVAPLLCAGNHHLQSAEALEGGAGQQGRHRGPRRPRTHGPEVCPRLRRGGDVVHNLRRQGRRCAAAGRE